MSTIRPYRDSYRFVKIISRILLLQLGLFAITIAATAENTTEKQIPIEIWKINADGTDLAPFADTTGWVCGSPEWSPDGKWVAYDAWRLDQQLEDAQVIVVRADGTDSRNLGLGSIPTWSPDGTQIAAHVYGIDASGKRTTGDSIVVMNVDGSGRETVINHWGSPRWLRQGNRIISILNNNIALFNFATGKERVLLPQSVSMYWGLGASPDGKRFCFAGSSSGLYLAMLDEQKMQAPVRKLLTEGECRYPSFAPDGHHIVVSYRTEGGRFRQLYTLDVDTDTGPHLLPGQDPMRTGGCPNWSPDGKTIVFVSIKVDEKPAPSTPDPK